MKKPILFFFNFLSCLTAGFAQLPNPSFENWNSVSYTDPMGWYTANQQSVQQYGIAVVTQVTGFMSSAVHMQTTQSGTDTIGAFISNTQGDPITGQGGLPYNSQVVAINGYYRYNLLAGDTALLLVIFKKNGSIISNDLFKITGSQSTFTFFNFPLTISSTPDTVIVAAASSNLVSNVGVMPGSFLELDELAFMGGVVTPPIPGGTFDNWNNFLFETPQDWTSLSNGVTKSTDKYAGNFALRLETQDYGNGNVGPGAVTTGQNSPGSGPVGGLPYILMTDTLTGYYKYTPSGPDSGALGISLTNNGNSVGGAGYYFTPQSVYTYFEIPFSSFSNAPDTMRIDIFSSKFPFLPSSIGSVLLMDDLKLKSQTGVGIETHSNDNLIALTYPNPVHDVLIINLNKAIQEKFSVSVFDISGKKIKTVHFNSGTQIIHLNTFYLEKGLYRYNVIRNNTHEVPLSGTFIRQ